VDEFNLLHIFITNFLKVKIKLLLYFIKYHSTRHLVLN